MPETMLELIETNEAGNVTATYVQTATDNCQITRIDRIVSRSQIIAAKECH